MKVNVAVEKAPAAYHSPYPQQSGYSGEATMVRFQDYDPQQTKMTALSYPQQLLPGSFEHALSVC